MLNDSETKDLAVAAAATRTTGSDSTTTEIEAVEPNASPTTTGVEAVGTGGTTTTTTEIEEPITIVEITSVSSLLVGVPLTVVGTSWADMGPVTKVEVQLGIGATFQLATPRALNDWSTWSFTTTPTVAGNLRITAKATSRWTLGGVARTHTGTTYVDVVMAPDTTGPGLTITDPKDTAIPGDETGKDVIVKGTASDSHSGLQRVEWNLDSGAFQLTTPGSPGNWSNWSFNVRIPALNEHTVTVRAWDNAGNATTKPIKLSVLLPYRAEDVQNNTSPLGYLKNLLDFAKLRLTISDAGQTRNVQFDDLVREFLQPFDAIRTDESVHQLRISVEVLRKYLAAALDTVWIDEKLPAGATASVLNDAWNWVTTNPAPYLSTSAHQSNVFAGIHQQVFAGATQGLQINPGDRLFAYVYLDPANAPSEVMLQWNDGSWEHRAFWGADHIPWGTAGTVSRRNMGPLPPVGKWVRLEVPASHVGLEGRTLNGMAFTLPGGRVTWGRAGKTAEPRQLLAHWKLDETTGTSVADATGNGNNGTISGAATWVAGRSGNALNFDGVNSSVSLVNQPALTGVTNNFTIAFWANPQGTHTITPESNAGTGGISGQRYVIGPQQGGTAFGNAAHSGAGVSVATNGVTVVDHTDFTIPALLVHQAPISGWTHIAVVFENKQPRLFINGKLVRTGLASPRGFVHTVPQNLGGMNYGFYKGLLDDVRIYNRPLTAWEIDALIQGKASSTPAADLAAAESAYCQASYKALLNNLGTSYEELRLARSADAATRAALAQRLGIDLAKLDGLFLEMPQVTEDKLEKLFGLVDSTRSALAAGESPALLIWQREYLRTLWKQDDHPTGPEAASLAPMIDPDVIGEEFVIKSTQSNSAYALWQQRRTLIDGQLSQLAADKPPGESAKDRFDRLVSARVAPITELLTLEGRRRQGDDILPDLQLKQLSLPAFSYLMRMRNVVLTASLLDAEWADIYSILTQVWKIRNYQTWRSAETDLTLGPDWFRIPLDTGTGAGPQLPTWRATEQDRRPWLKTLQARIEADQTLAQALQSVVDATEEATLPSLRDALITAINATVSAREYRSDAEVASWLTAWLLIEVNGSGFQKTSRINQAIETLQGILFSLRTENFKTIDIFADPKVTAARGKWKLAVTGADFDAEWLWMSSYANWRAATNVFLYPENFLLPNLRENPTAAFVQLMTRLRNAQSLTPQQARIEADKYMEKLRADMALPAALQLPFKISEDKDRAALRTQIANLFSEYVNLLPVPHLRVPPPVYLEEIFFFVPLQLALRLQQARQFTAALDWFRLIYDYNLPVGERKIYYGLVLERPITTTYQRTPQWLRDWLNPHTIARNSRADAYTKFTLISIIRCMLEYADGEFTIDSNESTPRARMLYMSALVLLNVPEFAPPPPATAIAPNPVPQVLRQHADLNLFKLRNGRNIAGMRRQLEPYVAPQSRADAASRQDGQAAQLQPTPYRYSALIERAKQLVNIAQQVEAAYLAALEKADAENYSLIKARQDLSLSKATFDLQGLRVAEAEDGVALANFQTARSQAQLNHYNELLKTGFTALENASLTAQWVSIGLQTVASGLYLASGVQSGLSPQGVFTLGASSTASFAQSASALAGASSSLSAVLGTYASYERRAQEWQLQQSLSQQDVFIGQTQISMATHRKEIAGKEKDIAFTQNENAQATVNFLATKFTNADLYEFMSGVLRGVYSYFLQQATATARLAQNQLSFERQEGAVSFIQTDYWQTTSESGGSSSSSNGQGTDRRGITGSARLLRDIYQLDQFAFETNKRKLQLTKTISLAQLMPVEFQHFRQTGVLRFATPMELFDRDFPGHYLRLIKRVRTSVIALIPPIHGIRATLATTGVSRVTSGGEIFQTAVIRRDPELVALSSPNNSTGLFELEQQPDMLLPFEAMGVDTSWEFQLPKAANPFDYNAVADVLISIDYTALNHLDYREQVIRSLSRDLSADRAFSLRQHFLDQWYDINNPSTTATEIIASLTIKREDFPPNIENLSLKHVTLFFARSNGESFELPVSLRFTPEGGQEASGAAIDTNDGIISTRRGNASSWVNMIAGKTPVGVWKLVLPNTQEVRGGFQNDKVEDILLVLTYDHRTPSWPA